MKRIATMALVICMLAGCGAFGHNTYISVTPHDEEYQVAVDSSALTVSGYLSLKNAILGLVEDAVEEGVIRSIRIHSEPCCQIIPAARRAARKSPVKITRSPGPIPRRPVQRAISLMSPAPSILHKNRV